MSLADLDGYRIEFENYTEFTWGREFSEAEG
jgi:hypothetical protein